MTKDNKFKDLKNKYPTYDSDFKRLLYTVFDKVLMEQSIRDPNSKKLYFKRIANSFHPYITCKKDQATNSERYSEFFKRRKSEYAPTWKHILPEIFKNVELDFVQPTIPHPKKVIDFVDFDMPKDIQEVNHDSFSPLTYNILIKSNETDDFSFKCGTVPHKTAMNIMSIINQQMMQLK